MMANVAVRNWRFLYKMGISGCQWFEGLGNYLQVRKLAICGADAPTIGTGFADRADDQSFVYLSGHNRPSSRGTWDARS